MPMNPNVGQELKKIREAKGISLARAAQDICLRTDLLVALEEDREAASLDEPYRRLSLRMYARYLGVNVTNRRHPAGRSGGTELSPVDGCVELAYSDDMREKPEPKKRRGLRTGTLLAAAAVVILATGLWSLNAKLSRLGDDGKPVRPAVAKAENNPPALTAPVTPALGLEDSVFLTLTPPPVPADSPAE